MSFFAREKLDEVVDDFVWSLPEAEFNCMSSPEHGFEECQRRLTSDYKFVDAIIAALPGLVEPLQWFKGGERASDWRSESPLHSFLIYENAQEGWTLNDGMAVSPHVTLEEAKEAAQTRYTALIMAALGITDFYVKSEAVQLVEGLQKRASKPSAQEMKDAVAEQDQDITERDEDADATSMAREKLAEAIWREGIGKGRQNDAWPREVIGQSQELFRSKADAVIAALPTLVPTLEWEQKAASYGSPWLAKRYSIYHTFPGFVVAYHDIPDDPGLDKKVAVKDTLEEAKAAAQEHAFKEFMAELYQEAM